MIFSCFSKAIPLCVRPMFPTAQRATRFWRTVDCLERRFVIRLAKWPVSFKSLTPLSVLTNSPYKWSGTSVESSVFYPKYIFTYTYSKVNSVKSSFNEKWKSIDFLWITRFLPVIFPLSLSLGVQVTKNGSWIFLQ